MVKDTLLEAFKRETGKELTKDFDVKELVTILNAKPPLRKLFREAVEDCAPTSEENAAAGLGTLFDGCGSA